MNAIDCMNELMRRERLSARRLSQRLGYSNYTTVAALLSHRQTNARSDRLVRYLDAMGYDLVARNRKNGYEVVIDE